MVAIHCGKKFICYCFNSHIRQRQLNFFCTGLTKPNFWQIKIIIPISHTNFSFLKIFISLNELFFFQITIKYIKKLTLLNDEKQRCGRFDM